MIRITLAFLMIFCMVSKTAAEEKIFIFSEVKYNKLYDSEYTDFESISKYFNRNYIQIQDGILSMGECKYNVSIQDKKINHPNRVSYDERLDMDATADFSYWELYFSNFGIDYGIKMPIQEVILNNLSVECATLPIMNTKLFIFQEDLFFEYGNLIIRYKISDLLNATELSEKEDFIRLPSAYPHICEYEKRYYGSSEYCKSNYKGYKIYKTFFLADKKIEYVILSSYEKNYMVLSKEENKNFHVITKFIMDSGVITFEADKDKLIVNIKNGIQLEEWFFYKDVISLNGDEISTLWPFNTPSMPAELSVHRYLIDNRNNPCHNYQYPPFIGEGEYDSCLIDKNLSDATLDFFEQLGVAEIYPKLSELSEKNKKITIKYSKNESSEPINMDVEWKSEQWIIITLYSGGGLEVSDAKHFKESNGKTIYYYEVNYM